MSELAANSSNRWRFGVFEVDAREGQLRRGGRPIKMRDQSLRILILLLEHAGEIVSREDLRRALWPSDTYVDFDHSLNTAVMKLRDTLGDSADTPLYIETIPKRGYRFVAPVATVPRTAVSLAASPGVPPAHSSTGIGPSAASHEDDFRIRVMPFEHSGADPEVAAVADGLAPALVAGLLRFSYLLVNAGETIRQTALAPVPLVLTPTARYILAGSIRQEGSRLRIAAQLVDGTNGSGLWAETYERSRPEAGFSLQDEVVPRIVSTVGDVRGVIARHISEALRGKDIERMSPREAVLRSFAHFQRVSSEEHAPARWALERAVEHAPVRADCWAMLSLLYREEYAHGFNPRPDPLGRAFAAAQHAIEAEPSNHLGHHAMASVLYFRRQIPAFRDAAERAMTLNPTDSFTIAYLGFLTAYAGEWERGCSLAERARSLNPYHAGWYWFAHLFDAYRKTDYAAAADYGQKINMPKFWRTNVALAAAYGQLGELDAARAACQALLLARPEFASSAREELGKWWEPELVDHLMDGLRKAGLAVGLAATSPKTAGDQGQAADRVAEVEATSDTAPSTINNQPVHDQHRLDDALVAVATAAALAAERLTQRRRLEVMGAIAGLLLMLLGGFFLLRGRRGSDSLAAGQQIALSFRIVPVTTASGEAISPVFSPDGREVAYLWDGPERRHLDIYVQLVGAELPLRLTYSQRGVVGAPAWSPDGQELAFTRCDGIDDGVYVVPALGGDERKLTTVGCLYTLPGPIAWLPDGTQMLMIDHCPGAGGAETFSVVRFSLATGEKRCLINSGSSKGADAGFGFALSPDAKTVAYKSTTVSLCCDIFTVPLAGGPSKQLTAEGKLGCNTLTDYGCSGLMWTPDSKSIVLVSNRSTLPSLWRISAKGGAMVREIAYPALGSFSKDGRKFVYSEKTSAELPAIWRDDLEDAGGRVLSHRKIISTQFPEMDAQPSPDGSRLVWMSIRTGYEELWSSSPSGGSALQLTHLERYSGTPRWSPEGKWVVFDSYTPHGSQIFVVDAEGRNLDAITDGHYDNAVPSWSRDGKAIYFASKRTGSWQVWKHMLQGGAESQLTEHGGFDPWESWDGNTVYYSRFDRSGIWSIPSHGGAEALVIADKPQVGYWGHWAVAQTGLYFLDAEADPRPTIEFYQFATHRVTPVITLEQRPARLQPSLSSTADGKTLYYTQYDRQSVIKMMEFTR